MSHHVTGEVVGPKAAILHLAFRSLSRLLRALHFGRPKSMHSRLRGLLPLVLLLFPALLSGQSGFGLTLEGRGGWAIPAGEFGADSALSAEGGPTFAVGGRVNFAPAVGVYAAYQQTRFGCALCEALGLDDSTVLDGLEAGLHLTPAARLAYSPWLRGGIIQQQLGFSGSGKRLTSKSAPGFSGALGIAIDLSPSLEFSPGVSFLSVPAEFEFETVPDRSIDVTAFTIDLGVAYRF